MLIANAKFCEHLEEPQKNSHVVPDFEVALQQYHHVSV